MDKQKNLTLILAMFLLLLAALMVMVPGTEAGTYDDIEIENGDYWSKKIKKPPEDADYKLKYEIFVDELDGLNFDVYILGSDEIGKYKDGEDFEAAFSKENINSTGMINWSIGRDKSDFYLVVDNRDNIHADDAYANETITLDITLKVKEKKSDLGFIFCCIVLLPIFIVIGIILWVVLEPRMFPQSRSKKYLNLTQAEAFRPLPQNPPLAKSRKKGNK